MTTNNNNHPLNKHIFLERILLFAVDTKFEQLESLHKRTLELSQVSTAWRSTILEDYSQQEYSSVAQTLFRRAMSPFLENKTKNLPPNPQLNNINDIELLSLEFEQMIVDNHKKRLDSTRRVYHLISLMVRSLCLARTLKTESLEVKETFKLLLNNFFVAGFPKFGLFLKSELCINYCRTRFVCPGCFDYDDTYYTPDFFREWQSIRQIEIEKKKRIAGLSEEPYNEDDDKEVRIDHRNDPQYETHEFDREDQLDEETERDLPSVFGTNSIPRFEIRRVEDALAVAIRYKDLDLVKFLLSSSTKEDYDLLTSTRSYNPILDVLENFSPFFAAQAWRTSSIEIFVRYGDAGYDEEIADEKSMQPSYDILRYLLKLDKDFSARQQQDNKNNSMIRANSIWNHGWSPMQAVMFVSDSLMEKFASILLEAACCPFERVAPECTFFDNQNMKIRDQQLLIAKQNMHQNANGIELALFRQKPEVFKLLLEKTVEKVKAEIGTTGKTAILKYFNEHYISLPNREARNDYKTLLHQVCSSDGCDGINNFSDSSFEIFPPTVMLEALLDQLGGELVLQEQEHPWYFPFHEIGLHSKFSNLSFMNYQSGYTTSHVILTQTANDEQRQDHVNLFLKHCGGAAFELKCGNDYFRPLMDGQCAALNVPSSVLHFCKQELPTFLRTVKPGLTPLMVMLYFHYGFCHSKSDCGIELEAPGTPSGCSIFNTIINDFGTNVFLKDCNGKNLLDHIEHEIIGNKNMTKLADRLLVLLGKERVERLRQEQQEETS
jgi:hypothetical protein